MAGYKAYSYLLCHACLMQTCLLQTTAPMSITAAPMSITAATVSITAATLSIASAIAAAITATATPGATGMPAADAAAIGKPPSIGLQIHRLLLSDAECEGG